MKETELYRPARIVVDIFNEKGMRVNGSDVFGPWVNQRNHAKVNVALLAHYYPDMDKDTQLRANRTVENLTAQHGRLA